MIKSCKHIFLLPFSSLFIIASFAQSKNEQIKFIREKFEIINKDTALRKVTLENEQFLENMTDGGGELQGYYKDNKVKKIHEWVGLSNGINIREFYFNDDQLIFVYEKFDSFIFDNKKNEFDFSKTKTIFEGRYYFKDKKLFSYSVKGKKSLAGQDESTEKTLLESAENNMNLLSIKAN